MGVRMTVTVDDRDAHRAVEDARRAVPRGWAAIRDDIARDARGTFQAIFMTAGGFVGRPWPPLAASTLRRKPGRSARILVETGELWKSLTEAGHPHAVLEASRDGLVVGTDDPKAAYHQAGNRNLPRREILPEEWPEGDVRRWAALLADDIERRA